MPIHDLSTLFELLPIGAYRLTMRGEILRANAALIRLNGFDNEEQMRQTIGNVVPNQYREQSRRDEFWRLLTENGHVTNFESEMVRLGTGEPWWGREHAHVVRDANGESLYYEGTVEEITKERADRAALLQREALLNNLLQTIPDKVWLKDPQGIYLASNEAFSTHFAGPDKSIIGTADRDWVDPQLAESFLATDRLAIQAGRAVMFEEEMSSPVEPVAGLHEIIKAPMRDDLGQVIGVLGMARNIQQRKEAEQLLRDTTEQLELALMGADLGRWDHELEEEKGYYIDERSCQMLGRDPKAAHLGQPWGYLVHPDDLAGVVHAMRSYLLGQATTFEAEYRALHRDGHWIWVSSRGRVVQTSRSGKPLRMVGTMMDISARKQAEEHLRDTKAELQATLDAMPDVVFELSSDGRFRAVHCQDLSMLLHPPEFLINKSIIDVMPMEAAEVCLTAVQEAMTLGRSAGKQYSLELASGKLWFEISVVRKPTESDAEARCIAIARDITERKASEEAIRHLAFHDSLTGLPNRRLLTDRLQRALSGSSRHGQYGALMFLDLDQFKQLNDMRGHEVGDLLLGEVARRLQQSVRAVDTVARLGGDEFVVLIQELSSEHDDAHTHASMVGHKILSSLNEPYLLRGEKHFSTPSVGVTLFVGDSVDHHEILKQADIAMYQAKAQGRNRLCFFAHH
jgi:diguanylate cyclase (GGDEF)-like protein/PAS domain S-box-containing protein